MTNTFKYLMLLASFGLLASDKKEEFLEKKEEVIEGQKYTVLPDGERSVSKGKKSERIINDVFQGFDLLFLDKNSVKCETADLDKFFEKENIKLQVDTKSPTELRKVAYSTSYDNKFLYAYDYYNIYVLDIGDINNIRLVSTFQSKEVIGYIYVSEYGRNLLALCANSKPYCVKFVGLEVIDNNIKKNYESEFFDLKSIEGFTTSHNNRFMALLYNDKGYLEILDFKSIGTDDFRKKVITVHEAKSICFSEDNKFLYFRTDLALYQIDLDRLNEKPLFSFAMDESRFNFVGLISLYNCEEQPFLKIANASETILCGVDRVSLNKSEIGKRFKFSKDGKYIITPRDNFLGAKPSILDLGDLNRVFLEENEQNIHSSDGAIWLDTEKLKLKKLKLNLSDKQKEVLFTLANSAIDTNNAKDIANIKLDLGKHFNNEVAIDKVIYFLKSTNIIAKYLDPDLEKIVREYCISYGVVDFDRLIKLSQSKDFSVFNKKSIDSDLQQISKKPSKVAKILSDKNFKKKAFWVFFGVMCVKGMYDTGAYSSAYQTAQFLLLAFVTGMVFDAYFAPFFR